jgi:beta-galactosidase
MWEVASRITIFMWATILCSGKRSGRALALVFSALLAAAPTSVSAAPRTDIELNADWKFQRGDSTVADNSRIPTESIVADAAWQNVALPHCWGWEEAQKGKPYYRGPGWYWHQVNVTPAVGRRYFVRFEAAGSVADVYFNGKLLGQHRGAFGAFCFEITKQLLSTGTNSLAVRVSNAAEPDVTPLSGDFPVYGGLYRSVHLIETDDACLTLTDHASPGVAWLQSNVSALQAVLNVTPQISNGTTKDQPVTLVAKVMDADGHEVARSEEKITLKPSVTAPYPIQVTVLKPHLWNGRRDPYLYQAVVELRSAEAVRDSVEQPLGLRSYYVDPDNGFFLNGQPYHLHGVNRHQDRLDKGWAISHADQDQDIALIKELGCTVLRCSHYEQSDYFYSLCDKAGILVWAELSQVDKIGASPEFADTSRNQLIDLIRQNVNHSSIFVWSLFNELRPKNPDPHRELQDLKIVANGEDPTRPTIAATCTTELPQMNKIPDLLGWNVYYGWYGDWGPLSDFGPMRAGYRYTSRSGGYCVSEYGAGANVNQHQENPGRPKNDGQWHPEEYQGILHEKAWAELKSAPYIWGTFVWCMFDFTSYWRHEGGVPGRNDKGLVTADRKIKKDAFYFYKANWSDEPVLYVTSRRYVERTNAITDVKIYSNASQAELQVNRASQGVRTNNGNGVILWQKVKLAAGTNSIDARAQRNGQSLTDHCEWTLSSDQSR